MKVLVTGAKGMLGQDLCPIFEDAGAFVIETDVDTLDITNHEQVKQVLSDIRLIWLFIARLIQTLIRRKRI